MKLRGFFGAPCRWVTASALALLLLAAGLHLSTEQAAAATPPTTVISVETLAAGPVSDVRSAVVDDRPDLARPPPVEAASLSYESSTASPHPVDGLGRIRRVSSGLELQRSAPRPTLSGKTVLGGNWDDAIRAGRGAKPLDGFHDVVAHGTPTGIYDEVGNLLSPSEAAAVIRGTPSWGGQNVRLLSCSTGCPTGNFAQGLADELGVAVRAPTVDFYVNSRGVPVLDPGGQWLTYLPGGG